jgi:protein SCO1
MRRPMRFLSAVILVAIAGGMAWRLRAATDRRTTSLPYYDSPDFTPRWAPVAHRVAPFRLVDQRDRPFTEKDLDGRIHVASFLFTSCPGVCPTLVSRLKPVQAAIRTYPDVAMLSFSVTPLTDTPEVLAAFGALRGIDPNAWRLLTGDLAEIQEVMRGSYFANDARPLDDSNEPKLLHTEKVLLVDKQRRLRGIYNGTNAFEMERLVDDIAALRSEG